MPRLHSILISVVSYSSVLELLNTAISIDILIIHGADWDQSRVCWYTHAC